jgi:RsiW-degrading membrane proteinase PrsW (M82 family)
VALFAAPRVDMRQIGGQNLNRSNVVYLIVGALVIVVAVLGYELYQDRKQPEGVRIDVGPKGLLIEKK